MWICPLCRKPLVNENVSSLTCSSGHCYDLAREGYVNLLLVNRKHSQEPGDSKAMIAARARVHADPSRYYGTGNYGARPIGRSLLLAHTWPMPSALLAIPPMQEDWRN